MVDFYIEAQFDFKGKLYGRLRTHSNKSFVRYVAITKITPHYTNWFTVDEEEEKNAKAHYERTKKPKKK